jgi:hypothetical protein
VPSGSAYVNFGLQDANYLAVSEGMGYGMLITVVMSGYDPNAQATFDALYKFVKAFPATLMVSSGIPAGANLMSWRINADGTSTGNQWYALDGDLDIALALLMADAQWGSTSGAYNYASEAATRIAAIKAVAFVSDGTIVSSQTGAGNRTSDYMYGHFRAFGRATGDGFWGSAVAQQLRITNYMQATWSPVAGLLPDWVQAADSATPFPSSGNIGDSGANPHENAYWYNACRDPWRSGADLVLSGDPSVKTTIVRMEDFFLRDTGGIVSNIVAGYGLDGSHLVAVNPGGFVVEPFQCPIAVGAMADSKYQAWLDANWAYMKAHPARGYYGTEIQLLCAMVISGNWWTP